MSYIENVKRKRPPIATLESLPVVPEVLLQQARQAILSERYKSPQKCAVCGEECAPNSTEGLCWVCRRLKLSAWRDSDVQVPVQE